MRCILSNPLPLGISEIFGEKTKEVRPPMNEAIGDNQVEKVHQVLIKKRV